MGCPDDYGGGRGRFYCVDRVFFRHHVSHRVTHMTRCTSFDRRWTQSVFPICDPAQKTTRTPTRIGDRNQGWTLAAPEPRLQALVGVGRKMVARYGTTETAIRLETSCFSKFAPIRRPRCLGVRSDTKRYEMVRVPFPHIFNSYYYLAF